MRDLVIVEATGKVRRMEALLREAGINADVIATAGHIADNPAKLSPIALTSDLRETDYRFRTDRRELLDKIRSSAARADRIFVATDDDQEGDVIAHDVARLLESRNDRLQRVRLRAITSQEIKQSFLEATRDGFAANACAGECRRIVDRAIGATFASVGAVHALPVGRVQSSALISIAESPPTVGSFGVELEGSDGGIYRCDLPVRSNEDFEFGGRLVDALAKGEVEFTGMQEVVVPVAQRWNYEDVVAEIALRMHLEIRQAADAFQTAYEEGYVSYPRVRSRSVSQDAVELAYRLAERNRCGFSPALLKARDDSGGEDGAHESPRPGLDDLLLGRPLSMMGRSEGVAVLIGRNLLESGQERTLRRVEVSALGRDVVLENEVSCARAPWRRSRSEPGYHPLPTDVALLAYLAEKGMGRPSTIVTHVDKLLSRGMIAREGYEMGLTPKGLACADRAKQIGFTAETSRRMELGFAAGESLPHVRAKAILTDHGLIGPVLRMASAKRHEDRHDAAPSSEHNF
ncbi:toprim domain-containing protein [Pandoraea sp. ISTKB]|uniref:toprim domain-containing protein n=1 Tax=Pandoraea sp. ISTKB TaxID=1586708 RepID=UPI000847604E|nr:toprim domain-containing protein [Pandoraea sp. ISTKB]ODP35075.1 hypothetical protein A9762_11985 [Pandoraea sp. ISTKB]